MPITWRVKGGEEDGECDGRTALRGIWEVWDNYSKTEWSGDDWKTMLWEKKWKEKTKMKMMVTMANPTSSLTTRLAKGEPQHPASTNNKDTPNVVLMTCDFKRYK